MSRYELTVDGLPSECPGGLVQACATAKDGARALPDQQHQVWLDGELAASYVVTRGRMKAWVR